MKILRNDEKPSTQAIGRIIGIEWKRLKQAARVGDPNPAEVAKRVASKARDRAPIMCGRSTCGALEAGIDKNEAKPGSDGHSVRRLAALAVTCPLGRVGSALWASFVDPFGIWGGTNFRVPNIWTSLRVLELELASQIRFGMRTAPLRVLRLGVSALIVTVVALMAQLQVLRGSSGWSRPRGLSWSSISPQRSSATWRRTGRSLRATEALGGARRGGCFPIKEGVGFLVEDNGGTLRTSDPLDRPDGMHPKKVLTTRGPVTSSCLVVPRKPLRLEPGPMDWIMRWT